MAKVWAVVKETKKQTFLCRFPGMENSAVGPWDMLAIFPEKRRAARARDKFHEAGYKTVTIIPCTLEPME